MKIYQQVVYKDLFKIIGLLLSIFGGFYLSLDFLDRFPPFLSFHKPLYLFIIYIFWRAWLNLYEFFPFILGLSGICLLSWWSRNRELLAFLSLGFSKKELIGGIMWCILFISLIGGVILNFVFPKAAYYSIYTWDYKIAEKKPVYTVFKEKIFFQDPQLFLIAKPLEPKGEYLKDLTVIFLKNKEPWEIIWADTAIYKDNKWYLKNVIIQKKDKNFSPKEKKEISGKFSFKPELLVIVEKSLKFLSFKELYQRYKFLKKINKPYFEVITEFFWRFLYLFIPFCLAFPSVWIYLKEFTPTQYSSAILKSLGIYFIMLIVILFLGTLLRKGVIWCLFLFLMLILIIFYGFFKEIIEN